MPKYGIKSAAIGGVVYGADGTRLLVALPARCGHCQMMVDPDRPMGHEVTDATVFGAERQQFVVTRCPILILPPPPASDGDDPHAHDW